MVLFTTIADDRAGRKGGKYGESQDFIARIFQGRTDFGIDKFAFWKYRDLAQTQFYQDNRMMLDHPDPDMNGRCYKPFIILDALKSVQDGDFVIYNDVSPGMWASHSSINVKTHSIEVLKFLCMHNGGILSAAARLENNVYDHIHENFTTERCMNKMDMQAHRYDLQHASGMIVLQKSKKTLEFAEEWLHWNLDPECASLGPIVLENVKAGETVTSLNGYVVLHQNFTYWNEEVANGHGKLGHRHDQSISGLLINKMHGKLVNETCDYCFMHFCQKDKNYEFIESNQPMLPYRLKMRHGTTDGTDGVYDKIPR